LWNWCGTFVSLPINVYVPAYVADVYCFAFRGDSDGETYKMWTIIDLISVLRLAEYQFRMAHKAMLTVKLVVMFCIIILMFCMRWKDVEFG